MFDILPSLELDRSTCQTRLDNLRTFVGEHREALLDAAAILGGPGGVRVAQTVIDGLRKAEAPPRRVMKTLGQLRDLLMLEHVHEPWRHEAALFAEIDPASPFVEQICLLADGLSDAIDNYRHCGNCECIGERGAA